MPTASNTITHESHDRVHKVLQSDFMKPISEDILHDIVKEFISHTGNDAMKTCICACCSLEIEMSNISRVSIDSIPHPELLVPTSPHPCHDIFQQMLLEPHGVDPTGTEVNLCSECIRELRRNKLPPLALANNMWIGRVTDCLAKLTLVEKLLIAKYLPTAYIFKLYPKQAGAAHWDRNQLYNGFKGCVSTYSLDPNLVADMIDGIILPLPPAVLSSTVGVTFITPSGKQQFSLPKVLYARRRCVREALEWLKANNPLYSNITISEERLQQIPEEGVPSEIHHTARHSTAIDAVIREHEAYAPSDDIDKVLSHDIEGEQEAGAESGEYHLSQLSVCSVYHDTQ